MDCICRGIFIRDPNIPTRDAPPHRRDVRHLTNLFQNVYGMCLVFHPSVPSDGRKKTGTKKCFIAFLTTSLLAML